MGDRTYWPISQPPTLQLVSNVVLSSGLVRSGVCDRGTMPLTPTSKPVPFSERPAVQVLENICSGHFSRAFGLRREASIPAYTPDLWSNIRRGWRGEEDTARPSKERSDLQGPARATAHEVAAPSLTSETTSVAPWGSAPPPYVGPEIGRIPQISPSDLRATLRLPVGLLTLLDTNPPPGWLRPHARARYLALLRDLFEPDFKSRKGWRPLSVVALRARYGVSHINNVRVFYGPALLDHLEHLKVIHRNAKYSSTQHYCRKYKIRRAWHGRACQFIDLPEELRFTPTKKARQVAEKSDPALEALAPSLGLLVTDHLGAYALVSRSPKPVDYLTASRLVAALEPTIGVRGVHKAQAHLNSALRILEHRDTWLYRDGTSNRVHSQVANLPSALRRFVGFRGEPAVTMIDVRNSQLLLPCALLDKNQPDAFAWVDLAKSGMAYEAVFEAMYKRKPTKKQRAAFKEDFFRETWFASVFDTLASETSKVLAQNWPTVHALVAGLKQDDYRNFPVMMQRLEAAVVVDDAAMSLVSDGVPVVTIHDSVMVPAWASEFAQEALLSAFRAIGLEPDLQAETWSTPFAMRDGAAS